MPTILKNNIRLGGAAPKNIQLGGKDVKYAKLGNTIVYDTLSYYSYNTPSITFTYPSGNVAYSGGSKTPSARTWSQSYSPVGHSGTTYSGSSTSGTVTSFSIVSGSSYGTLDTSTGVFTFKANSSTGTRSVTIRASVTSNGKSKTKDVTITQAAMPVYTATVIWSNYNGEPWCFTNGLNSPTTHDNINAYFCHNSGTALQSFTPGGGLSVNTGPGTMGTVPSGGRVFCYYRNPNGRWYAVGAFTHDGSKSYTVTL